MFGFALQMSIFNTNRDCSVNHQCQSEGPIHVILNRWVRWISGQTSREWSCQNQAYCRPDNPLPLIIAREACVGFAQSDETYGSSICGLIRHVYPRPVAIFGLKPATFIDKICFSHCPYVLNGLLAPSVQVTNCSDSVFIVASCLWICFHLKRREVTVSLAI